MGKSAIRLHEEYRDSVEEVLVESFLESLDIPMN